MRSPWNAPPIVDATTRRDWSVELARLSGRRLTVYLDTTSTCNLRCTMCHFSLPSFSHRPARYMAPEELERIGRELFPLARTLYLSAACEPLTHPSFAGMLEVVGRSGVDDTRLLTNATLLSRATIDALIDANVASVQVSIDGADAPTYERIRRGASFDRVRERVAELAQRKRERGADRPRVQINVTLMRSNVERLADFVDLALELGAEAIACRHVMAYQGLDVASEALNAVPRLANERFETFLARAARAGVAVTAFPDFFAIDGERWLPSAADDEALDGSRGARRRGASLPFGRVDVPASARSRTAGRARLAGWALDRAGVERVELRREPIDGERGERADADGLIWVGDARILNGSRPDVSHAFPLHPLNYRAGWTFEGELIETRAQVVRVAVHVIAHSAAGRKAELGVRTFEVDRGADLAPRPRCGKPFDCVYVDAAGDVVPSPDCQNWSSFGRLDREGAFERIWFGDAWRDVRRRMLSGEPPASCRCCPDFINRNVDDARYFEERDVLRGGPD